jgi:hypothetical protein
VVNLSIALAKQKLIEADEVRKATVAKMKHNNRGTKEIKNPTSAVAKSERHDKITQIVQDSGFTADVAPKKGDDNPVPQADFADTYTKKMPHGQSGGTGGNGENQKSPKGVGTTGMKPNQTTKLKKITGEIKGTDDDRSQKVFTIPQAKFADEYTKTMKHGVAGGTTNEDGASGEPGKSSYGKMDGGPTRAGGKKTAKLGDNTVGAKDKDSQKAEQVSGPGKRESSPSDAMTWGSADYKKETHGAHNVVESGVTVTLKGKRKATFEVVSHKVLNQMIENYAQHGYELELVRTDAAWKKDAKFLKALRESIHAKYNHAPNFAKQARKVAMQRFGQLCKESYNSLYESRQEFVQTMGSAFKRIEAIAEDKYVDRLEFFDCGARLVVEGDQIDQELVTQATDKDMACRQVRNTLREEYGFGADIKHIFIDGEKFTPGKIREYISKL